MRSRARSNRLDLERDLPTTARDCEALRRARVGRACTLEEYLSFLSQIPTRTHEELRAKRGPCLDRPFVIA